MQFTPKQIIIGVCGLCVVGLGLFMLVGSSASNDAANAAKAMQQLRTAMIKVMQPKRQKLADNLERQVAELGACRVYDATNTYACQRPTYLPDRDEVIQFWRADAPLRKIYYQLWPYGSLQYVLQLNALDKAYVHVEAKHAPYVFEYDGTTDRLSYFSESDAARRPIDQAFYRNMILNYSVSWSMDSKVHSFLGLEMFPPLMQRLTVNVLGTAGNNIDLMRCRRQGEGYQQKTAAGSWEITCSHRKSSSGSDSLWLFVTTRDYSASSPVPFLN